MDDLYSYPDGHVGRKRYVSLRGHSKSVPSFKTYRGTDGRNHLRPEYGGSWDYLGNEAPMLMPDKLAYTSVVDGSRVESRSAHKEHMIRNDVYEAGDAPIGHMAGDNAPMPSVGESIKATIDKLSSR